MEGSHSSSSEGVGPAPPSRPSVAPRTVAGSYCQEPWLLDSYLQNELLSWAGHCVKS